MESITSRQNPLCTHIRKLASSASYRRQKAEFLCDSPKLLEEILLRNADLHTVVCTEDAALPPIPAGVRVVQVPADVMESLSPAKTPQGVLSVCGMPDRKLPERLAGKRYVVLDGVQDPGNVGTILRTADAAGFTGALMSQACADPYSPKVLRATMGSVFRMPIQTVSDLPAALKELNAQGFATLSSQLDGEPFFERGSVGEKFALIIGNEGNGVSDEVKAAATHHLALPMRGGAESLNAAIAAGIMMYDLTCR